MDSTELSNYDTFGILCLCVDFCVKVVSSLSKCFCQKANLSVQTDFVQCSR